MRGSPWKARGFVGRFVKENDDITQLTELEMFNSAVLSLT